MPQCAVCGIEVYQLVNTAWKGFMSLPPQCSVCYVPVPVTRVKLQCCRIHHIPGLPFAFLGVLFKDCSQLQIQFMALHGKRQMKLSGVCLTA